MLFHRICFLSIISATFSSNFCITTSEKPSPCISKPVSLPNFVLAGKSKQVETYDYIIAGGGCAGLSLVHRLLDGPLSEQRILIIDEAEKQGNDRTWCFWADDRAPFRELIAQSWPILSFADEQGEISGPLHQAPYHLIRSEDFYRHILDRIDKHPNVHWTKSRVTRLEELENGARVYAGDRTFEARWVFNSCIRPNAAKRGQHFLWQHFEGWWVRTAQPTFDPSSAMLMDFRTPQKNDTRFFYVLPVSPTEALIEYTVFSKDLLEPMEYRAAISDYCEQVLHLDDYTVFEEERGAIPMSDAPPNYRYSEHIVNVGTIGGAVKPSTGYAFLNIQEQAQQIAAQLAKGKRPDSRLSRPSKFRFYDILLLHILQYRGERGQEVFSRLFHHNRMHRILRFLSEKTGIWQELRIFASLPILLFLWALISTRQWLNKQSSTSTVTPSIFGRWRHLQKPTYR